LVVFSDSEENESPQRAMAQSFVQKINEDQSFSNFKNQFYSGQKSTRAMPRINPSNYMTKAQATGS